MNEFDRMSIDELKEIIHKDSNADVSRYTTDELLYMCERIAKSGRISIPDKEQALYELHKRLEQMNVYIDPTGTQLTPCQPEICNGNGKTIADDGSLIECCCDECDFYLACYP